MWIRFVACFATTVACFVATAFLAKHAGTEGGAQWFWFFAIIAAFGFALSFAWTMAAAWRIDMRNLQAQFSQYDSANPEVYDLFRRFAREIRDAGHNHYSADAILHRIRWHVATTRRVEDFKINNNYAAFYARKLMDEHPTFKGFFRTRNSVADAGREREAAHV